MSYQQPPGWGGGGYGPPPQQQGYPPQQQGPYGPPPGYGFPPQPPPKKGGFPAWAAILAGMVGLLFLCAIVGAITGGGKSTGSSGSSVSSPVQNAPSRATLTVPIQTILSAYKGNEIKADNDYKGRTVEITGGILDDVKKDILDQPYVTVGTRRGLEIPQVQCSLKDDQVSKAANLTSGQKITVRGEVRGLMMNVQLDDCEIL